MKLAVLINAAKQALAIESDRGLAKKLGCDHTMIRVIRANGAVSDDLIIKLASLAEIDPELAIYEYRASKSKTGLAREFWNRKKHEYFKSRGLKEENFNKVKLLNTA